MGLRAQRHQRLTLRSLDAGRLLGAKVLRSAAAAAAARMWPMRVDVAVATAVLLAHKVVARVRRGRHQGWPVVVAAASRAAMVAAAWAAMMMAAAAAPAWAAGWP